jgi:hypothetical protein
MASCAGDWGPLWPRTRRRGAWARGRAWRRRPERARPQALCFLQPAAGGHECPDATSTFHQYSSARALKEHLLLCQRRAGKPKRERQAPTGVSTCTAQGCRHGDQCRFAHEATGEPQESLRARAAALSKGARLRGDGAGDTLRVQVRVFPSLEPCMVPRLVYGEPGMLLASKHLKMTSKKGFDRCRGRPSSTQMPRRRALSSLSSSSSSRCRRRPRARGPVPPGMRRGPMEEGARRRPGAGGRRSASLRGRVPKRASAICSSSPERGPEKCRHGLEAGMCSACPPSMVYDILAC